jgi:hypothetical protein
VRAYATGQVAKGGLVDAIAVASLEDDDPDELAKSVKFVNGRPDNFSHAPAENCASL